MDHFFLLLKEEDDREVNRRILKMKEAVNERIRCKFSEYSIDFAVGACRLDIAGGVPTAMNKAIYASKLSDTDNVCSFYNAGIANMLEREERLNTLFEDSVKNRDSGLSSAESVSFRNQSLSGRGPCKMVSSPGRGDLSL